MTLDHVRVRDCMHSGIVSCAPDTPVGDVAWLMGHHQVHVIAVADRAGGRPKGIVADMDVMAAVAAGREVTAGQVMATAAPTISADERLPEAVQLMTELGVSHLIVVDPASGYPVGVLSTLDVASAYGSRQTAPASENAK
jgi:CBS domain-containing protein